MNPSTAPSGFRCLILDDDAGFAGQIREIVEEQGGRTVLCGTVAEARQQIERQDFDLACIDNRLPDGTGFDFHPHLQKRCPRCIVIMITGAPELFQAVELTRNGLFEYLTKPLSLDDFLGCLARARKRMSLGDGLAGDGECVGRSPVVRDMMEHLRQAARHASATVLLLGETGSGKDIAARYLHRCTHPGTTDRAGYVALNCPAVPVDMFEAELFGSEKGSYTGSDRNRPGLVESARGGTLFLDEVTEIPLSVQAKMLRFLESREYRPLGSTSNRRFEGRIVAATNKSLADEVRAGRFREDLMYRLDVTAIRVPALRERMEDLEPLSEHLLAALCTKYGRRPLLLRTEDLSALGRYHFPGNIRELRNLLERSLLRTPETASSLELDLGWLRGRAAATVPTPAAPPAPALERARSETVMSTGGRSALEQQEIELMQKVLREEGGAIRRSAARLGLSHQALLRRLQKWPELRQCIPSAQQ